MVFSKRYFLFKDDFVAVIDLIIADMLEHDEEMTSEMHSVLKKGTLPEHHQRHFCVKVCQSQSACLGILFKHRENTPSLHEEDSFELEVK